MADGLPEILRRCFAEHDGATVFVTRVANPGYGVLEMNDAGEPISIEEKPAKPKSDRAVTGLHAYDAEAVAIAKSEAFRARGARDNNPNAAISERSKLKAERLGRGPSPGDAVCSDSPLDAANFVATLEKRQSHQDRCPRETAFVEGVSVPMSKSARS